jgi:cob(I)alamin adenosyltransferase
MGAANRWPPLKLTDRDRPADGRSAQGAQAAHGLRHVGSTQRDGSRRLPPVFVAPTLQRVKLYTRTGDGGETSLFGGGRVPKDDVRVAAYGEVDALNAALGVATAVDPADFERKLLDGVQRDLFAIGGQLASPKPARVAKALEKAAITEGLVEQLERAIDRCDAELEPLKAFVLPGGTLKAALLHAARTDCRRAERSVVTLARRETVPPIILQYLNRLSDLLFALARVANRRAGVPDRTW